MLSALSLKNMAQVQTKPTSAIKTSSPSKEGGHVPVKFVFDKSNYRWFIIAIAVVIFGFILMSGTTDIYSTTKIVVAPVVVLAGFGIGFYAILKK
jgi:hypothetical protein